MNTRLGALAGSGCFVAAFVQGSVGLLHLVLDPESVAPDCNVMGYCQADLIQGVPIEKAAEDAEDEEMISAFGKNILRCRESAARFIRRAVLLITVGLVFSSVARSDTMFSDGFSAGASPLWGNEIGAWIASGGVYRASALSNFPNAHSSLPFSLTDFSVELDINDARDGGIWLRSAAAPGTAVGRRGVLLVNGGFFSGGNGLYWHVVTDGGTYGGALNVVRGLFTAGVSDLHIRIVVTGNTYSAYINGASIPATTLTTSAFASGRIALYDFSSQTFDNVLVDQANCTYSIAPTSSSAASGGGTGTVSVTTQSGCNWAAVSNSPFITVTSGNSGSGSGTVAYSVASNSGAQRTGTLTIAGRTFTLTQASASPTSELIVSPRSLSFTGLVGGASQRQALEIGASGGTLSWSASVTLLNGVSWLIASPPSGTAAANTPSRLGVEVNFGAFGTAGIYQAVIVVRNTASGATVRVPVTVTVSPARSRLLLSQSSFVFRTAVGGTPPAQILRIFNSGVGTLSWTIPANLTAPQNWLRFSSLSGTAGAGRISPTTLTVSTAGLSAGVYQSLVPVSAPGATNDLQLVTVTLHVAPAATAASPELSSHGMVFVISEGEITLDVRQDLFAGNTGSGSATFQFQTTTESGGNWLSVFPASGTVAAQSSSVSVQVDLTQLTLGTYQGRITGTFTPGGTRGVDVVLIYSGSPIVLARELPSAAQCAAQSIEMVVSSIGAGSVVPLSFPIPLVASVFDSCGSVVSDATVVASAGGGTPISLESLGDGLYSGTWVPDQISSAVPISVVAVRGTYPSVHRSFTVSTTAAAGQVTLPAIFPNGVVGAAGFTPRQPLAPGGIVAIFGSGFTSAIHPALQVPLPRQLGGVSVRIGTEDVPLYSVYPGQINAQVPYTAQSGNSVSVVVNAVGKLTAAQNYPIASVQPGIFVEGTISAVLDGQSRPITAANPALRGDTLQIFTSGLGETDPPGQTGQAPPSFSRVLMPVTVRIGGVQAAVVFQGLAPCCVGVYQVNAVLPSTVMPGDAVLIEIEQNGILSNPELPARITVR